MPPKKQNDIYNIHKKDHSDPNNYRGITLLSTLSKVYDKILLKRYENWFRTTLSNLQGVAEKGGSSINTALLLHEAIAHILKTHKGTYV